MKAIGYVKNHDTYDVDYALQNSFNAGFIAAKFESQINAFHEKFPDASLTIDGDSITLSRPSQSEKIAFLQAFGGMWDKDFEDYDKTKLTYFRKEDVSGRIITIKLTYAEPAPSCQIVEEEVDVPAQPARREVRKVMKCKPDVMHAEEVIPTAEDVPVDTGVPGVEETSIPETPEQLSPE